MPKRLTSQRENDLVITARMYMQGYNQYDIMHHLNNRPPDETMPDGYVPVTQQTISNDLDTIFKRWQESQVFDFHQAKMEQLAKIDLMEREAWQAWERSKEEFVKQTTQTDSSKVTQDEQGNPRALTRVTRLKEDRNGDPRYLEMVRKCVEMRIELLGLKAPDRWRLVDNDDHDILTNRNLEGAAEWLRSLVALPVPQLPDDHGQEF